jgi:hypothetical protein
MAAFFAKQELGTASITAVENNSAPSLLSAAGEALSRLGAPSASITGISVIDPVQEAEEFIQKASYAAEPPSPPTGQGSYARHAVREWQEHCKRLSPAQVFSLKITGRYVGAPHMPPSGDMSTPFT